MAKSEKAKKVHVYADGETGRSAKPDSVAIRFTFADGGGTYDVKPTQFGEEILACATIHGIAQKLGDSYASAKDAAGAEEAFLAQLEMLESGDWVTERGEGGPRISVIFEAVVAAYEKAGKPLSEEQKAERKEALKDAAMRKQALEVPAINAMYQRMLADRAIARAQKAAEAAQAAIDSGEGL